MQTRSQTKQQDEKRCLYCEVYAENNDKGAVGTKYILSDQCPKCIAVRELIEKRNKGEEEEEEVEVEVTPCEREDGKQCYLDEETGDIYDPESQDIIDNLKTTNLGYFISEQYAYDFDL